MAYTKDNIIPHGEQCYSSWRIMLFLMACTEDSVIPHGQYVLRTVLFLMACTMDH